MHYLYVILLLGLLCFESNLLSQQIEARSSEPKCKVLNPKISGAYVGECKGRLAHGKGIAQGEETYEGDFRKGLPHGDGKYIYQSGEFYVGEFQKGNRHGEGKMYTFDESTKELLPGNLALWKDDEYVMDLMESKYKLLIQRNLATFEFKKIDERKNSVEIILRNHITLDDMDLIHSSGLYTKQGNRLVIDQVDFPINIRLQYNTLNRVSESINILIQFEIESPGRWHVNLTPM